LIVEKFLLFFMLQRLVIRICSVLLTLSRSYFWVWEQYLSGVVASVLEEYASSMFMVNVTVNITTDMPCWTELGMCLAGCKCCRDSRLFGGSFHHGPCKFFLSETATHDEILKFIHIPARKVCEFLFAWCVFSDGTQWYTVSGLLLENLLGVQLITC
jgi:hypothetical protein